MRPVEEIADSPLPGVSLGHGWTLYTLEPLSAATAEAVLREPVAAVPASLAERLGALRVFAAPYLACGGEAEFVTAEPPAGPRHSSLWLEPPEGLALFLAFHDADAHDVGFELLAAVADLAVPRLTDQEFAAYERLLHRERREGATGEIDEEALEARRDADPRYPAASLAGTLVEYLHVLWHDVEVRSGPEHLAPKFLRRRFQLLQKLFPPNPGYVLFASAE